MKRWDDTGEVIAYVFDAHLKDTVLQFVYGDIQPTQLLDIFGIISNGTFFSSFHFAILNLSRWLGRIRIRSPTNAQAGGTPFLLECPPPVECFTVFTPPPGCNILSLT